MSTTTIAAIRTSLESTIKGLSPVTPHYGRRKFQMISPKYEWTDRPSSDWDREFEIDVIQIDDPVLFGVVSEVDYNGSFVVRIGHIKKPKSSRREGIDRRDSDLAQIKQNLEKSANFPTGVSLVRSEGWTSVSQPQGWLTNMTFRLFVTLAAV